MKNRKLLLISLITAVLISAWVFQSVMAAPLLDSSKKVFKLINDSDRPVTVTLTGSTENYSLGAGPGETKSIEVVKGKYTVVYNSCNDVLDFEADLTEKDYTLHLYPCGNQPSKLQVKSHLGEDVVLELFGYKNYEFDIEPGYNKIDMFSGDYAYSYEACGTTFSGEVNVGKNGISQLYLHSCEWFTDLARVYGAGNIVSFKIIDQASFPIYVTLIGPENYLVTVNPGVNIYTLVAGTYKYSYYLDGKLNSGTMVVTLSGAGSLILSPSYVHSIVDESNLE